MKTTEKWIYVDEEFEKNYPELYQKIIQLPEFSQYSEKKVKAGISKAGNIKLLWEFNHQTILPKEMLMKSELLYREYLSYISDFGKQLPTNMIQKSRWKEWFDVSQIEANILPELKTLIRQKLGKSNWKFELTIQNTWTKQNTICLLRLEASELSVAPEKQLSLAQLEQCNDMDSLRPYFLKMAEEMITDIRKIQKTERQRQLKVFIQNHWEEICNKAQECVDNYLKQQFGNSTMAIENLHCNKYENKKVYIMVSYLGMIFQCDCFPDQSISSFFRKTTWLTPYIAITKMDDQLMDSFTIDLEAALNDKLEKMVAKLEQTVKEGIPIDSSKGFVSYQKELQDKVKEYNQWKLSWLDGSKADMDHATSGKLYIERQEVVFSNDAGLIIVKQQGAKYTASERFKDYQTLKNSKLRKRCRQYAIESFSEIGHVKCKKEEIGILNGDTELVIKIDGMPEFSYQYKTNSYQESVTEWKKTVVKNQKEILALAEDVKVARIAVLQKQYKSYLDSYLVRDILDCVSVNETYITQNAVVQILRGTKVALNAPIVSSRGDGLYGLYSVDEVSKVVIKMIQSELLSTVSIKGTYGWFDLLKVPVKTKLELKELNTLKEMTNTKDTQNDWTKKKQEMIRKALRSNIAISDADAEQYLIHEILKSEKTASLADPKAVLSTKSLSKEQDLSSYMDLIKLVNHPIVLVLHETDVQDYFTGAPDSVIKFLKLFYKNAATREKKIIKRFFLLN